MNQRSGYTAQEGVRVKGNRVTSTADDLNYPKNGCCFIYIFINLKFYGTFDCTYVRGGQESQIF